MPTAENSVQAIALVNEQLNQIATSVMLASELTPDVVVGVLAGLTKIKDAARTAGISAITESVELAEAKIRKASQSGTIDDARSELSELQQKLASDLCAPEQSGFPDSTDDVSLAQDPQMVSDFVVECREHLNNAESLSLELEQDPRNDEAVNSLFRSFHSIKGLAAFLEFHRVQKFAHEIESLLDLAREGKLEITPTVIDIILASADFLGRCVAGIEDGTLSRVPLVEDALIDKIHAISEGTQVSDVVIEIPSEVSEAPVQALPNVVAPVPVETPKAAHSPAKAEVHGAPPVACTGAKGEQGRSGEESKGAAASLEKYSIRVDTVKLDYLMDMVGEMVIAESVVHNEIGDANGNNVLQRNLAQLAHITSEVQRTTMAMRMVPIGQLFRRTSRIVRDLARKFNKPVEVTLVGEETELDKTIAEELADPLMHMVRNSIDHGIEDPESRAKSGKPVVANVTLAAYHQGSQVVVEISDDGKGLNSEKILNKAREKGLVGEETLSESEVLNLVFHPGFSTAEQVTAVSGRGVGMDVVKRQVDKLRGRIEIESKAGQGAKFTIKLPLTRAIIDGLVVKLGEQRYIVPVSAVREVFRPAPGVVSTVQGKGEMVLVHNRLLPVYRLHRIVKLPALHEDPCESVLIVVEASNRQFCLMVDELIGKQEVVIKSLGSGLKDVRGVSGGTILGDGRVGLILDMHSVAGVNNV